MFAYCQPPVLDGAGIPTHASPVPKIRTLNITAPRLGIRPSASLADQEDLRLVLRTYRDALRTPERRLFLKRAVEKELPHTARYSEEEFGSWERIRLHEGPSGELASADLSEDEIDNLSFDPTAEEEIGLQNAARNILGGNYEKFPALVLPTVHGVCETFVSLRNQWNILDDFGGLKEVEPEMEWKAVSVAVLELTAKELWDRTHIDSLDRQLKTIRGDFLKYLDSAERRGPRRSLIARNVGWFVDSRITGVAKQTSIARANAADGIDGTDVRRGLEQVEGLLQLLFEVPETGGWQDIVGAT